MKFCKLKIWPLWLVNFCEPQNFGPGDEQIFAKVWTEPPEAQMSKIFRSPPRLKFGPLHHKIREPQQSNLEILKIKHQIWPPVTGKFLKIPFPRFGPRDWPIFGNSIFKFWPPWLANFWNFGESKFGPRDCQIFENSIFKFWPLWLVNFSKMNLKILAPVTGKFLKIRVTGKILKILEIQNLAPVTVKFLKIWNSNFGPRDQ